MALNAILTGGAADPELKITFQGSQTGTGLDFAFDGKDGSTFEQGLKNMPTALAKSA